MPPSLRRYRLRPLIGTLTASFFLASPAQAQYLGGGTKTASEVQVADLEALRDKFVALAQAFPEEALDWRPMEGVRSPRDVFALITAEATLFPSMWKFPSPLWVAPGGITAEMSRVSKLSKPDMVSELRRAMDHVIGLSRGLSDADQERQVGFFGLTTDLGTALTLMQTDMHEHLGQMIAYARANRIVPPWSR